MATEEKNNEKMRSRTLWIVWGQTIAIVGLAFLKLLDPQVIVGFGLVDGLWGGNQFLNKRRPK